MRSAGRTMDVWFDLQEMRNLQASVSEQGNTDERSADVSISNIDINLDVYKYDSSDYHMNVLIGEMLKGDKGDDGRDGYTPEKYVDYWNQLDIDEIHEYIMNNIDNISWETI